MKSPVFLFAFFICCLLLFGCGGDSLTGEDPIREPPPDNIFGDGGLNRNFSPSNIYDIIDKEILLKDKFAGQSLMLVNENNDYFIVRKYFGSNNSENGEIKYKVIFLSDYMIEFSEIITSSIDNPYIDNEYFRIGCRGFIQIYLNGVKLEIDYGDSSTGDDDPVQGFTASNIHDIINKELVLFNDFAGESLTLVYEDNEYFLIRKLFGSWVDVIAEVRYNVLFHNDYHIESSDGISLTLDIPYTLIETFEIICGENLQIFLNGLKVERDYILEDTLGTQDKVDSILIGKWETQSITLLDIKYDLPYPDIPVGLSSAGYEFGSTTLLYFANGDIMEILSGVHTDGNRLYFFIEDNKLNSGMTWQILGDTLTLTRPDSIIVCRKVTLFSWEQ